MKLRTYLLLIMLATGTLAANSQTIENGLTKVILSNYTARTFNNKPVTDAEIATIIECGIQAPSARNMQPWKFTVVKSSDLTAKIIPGTNPGNVVIVVSAMEAQQVGVNASFDCGLATQNMYVAAQSLGLGAHIYTSPVANVNSTMKQILEIPEGYSVISVLRVGNVASSVDAVSTASTRKATAEMVNYK